MINYLNIKNFTGFSEARFDFSDGLNIIIGDNSTGKSHLLQLAYAITHVWYDAKQEKMLKQIASDDDENWWWQRHIAEKLANKLVKVFKPETLGHLHRLGQKEPAEIEAQISSTAETKTVDDMVKFQFSETSKTEVQLIQQPTFILNTKPIFLPVKEVLSWYPGFTALYNQYRLAIDETYYDLCETLGNPLLNYPDKTLIEPLEKIIGGQVKLESDHFYIDYPEQGKREISLVAEGLRKIAMLSYLIANNSLTKGSILFWDEPENNLNPSMIKRVADLLLQLVKSGVQIIFTTHNLFLMKELALQIGNSPSKVPAQFFGFVPDGNDITVQEGETLTELPTVVALDEELALYDREHEAFFAAKESSTG